MRAQELGSPLPGTKPLTMTGDLASEMVAGADRFLLRQIEESAGKRESYWKRDFSSAEAYQASVEPNRKRLAHILGVRDARVSSVVRKLDGGMVDAAAFVPELNASYRIDSVSWAAFGDVTGEGIELDPKTDSDRSAARRDRDPGRGPDARATCRSG